MKIKDLLNEEAKQIISEQTLDAIQEAIEKKIELAVDVALEEQDSTYAAELEKLVKTIDKDHTKKMMKLVEAVDKSNASKLVKVVKKYERDSVNEAKKFKSQVVSTLSAYLEQFLAESFPKQELAQAVKNKTAYSVLENLRKVLAVDSVLMKESVQEAVIDGKKQLVEKDTELTSVKKQFQALQEKHERLEKDLYLESTLATYPKDKKEFLKKTFNDKPLSFIKENMDYVVKLFDKKQKEKITMIKEEALSSRKEKVDFVKSEKVVEEKVNTTTNSVDQYLPVLSKSFGKR